MNISSEDRYNLEVWFVLDKINYQLLRNKKNKIIRYNIQPSPKSKEKVNYLRQLEILEMLESEEVVIKREGISGAKEPDVAEVGEKETHHYWVTLEYYFEPTDKFKDYYKKYEQLAKSIDPIEVTKTTTYFPKEILDRTEEFIKRVVEVEFQRKEDEKSKSENNLQIHVDGDFKDSFGFEGKKFWLKRTGGQNLTISFNPKNGETTNPYCLMQAFVDHIRSYGKIKDGYLTVVVPVQKIVDYMKQNYPSLNPSDWKKWIKYTKNNLLQKLTDDDKELIVIKAFDIQDEGYPFSLKTPQYTP